SHRRMTRSCWLPPPRCSSCLRCELAKSLPHGQKRSAHFPRKCIWSKPRRPGAILEDCVIRSRPGRCEIEDSSRHQTSLSVFKESFAREPDYATHHFDVAGNNRPQSAPRRSSKASSTTEARRRTLPVA